MRQGFQRGGHGRRRRQGGGRLRQAHARRRWRLPTAGGDRERRRRWPGQHQRPLLQLRPDLDRRYVNRVRLGGIKFWLDGSIPTAWMSQPYAVNPPGTEPGFRGYQQIPDGVLEAAFERWWRSSVQMNMHMNDDAAAEQALRAIEAVVQRQGMADHRPVFIHASYLRPDQIQRMKAVGAVPSFLTTGLIPGGDTVVKLWGAERAANAMAAATMARNGMPYTFSHDAPVSPQPWVLALVDAGVNRRTPGGLVIGPAERVSPYQALQAVTSHAAWQIKEGRTIFRRDPATASGSGPAMGGGSSLPCLHDHDHGSPPPLSASARDTLKLLVRAGH
ncbi:MAG: amidohydrolase family protein [Cyanobium sp.]